MGRHCTNCSPAATHCLPICICSWHYCDRHCVVAFLLLPISKMTIGCLDYVELATCANYHWNLSSNFPIRCSCSTCKCHYFAYSNLQIITEKWNMNKIPFTLLMTNSNLFIYSYFAFCIATRIRYTWSGQCQIFHSFLFARERSMRRTNLRGATASGKWCPNRDTKPNNLFDNRFVWFGSFIKADWINGSNTK